MVRCPINYDAIGRAHSQLSVIAAADICGIAMRVMRHNSPADTLIYIYPAILCARARSAYGICSGFVGICIHITDLFNISKQCKFESGTLFYNQ